MELFGTLNIELLGRGCFISNGPQKEDFNLAQKAWQHCSDILKGNDYDVIILDELCIALCFHLISTEEMLNSLKERNPETEIVITGRNAPQELIDFADLVTDMQEVKHYYQKGVLSRNGIDR